MLYDEKWIKFRRQTWPFRFIPFVELALAAGSMAIGNVSPKSDFDVIVAAKTGRIFTARASAILVFGLLGWRRKKLSHKEDAADLICLNHFVTERSFRLSGPHDRYWQTLYKNLVPVYGNIDRINQFFTANADWSGAGVFHDDLRLRHSHRHKSLPKFFLEKFLSGWFGNRLESFLKIIQIRRIERGLANDPPGYQPRIIYNDDELEFHPDTARIAKLNETL